MVFFLKTHCIITFHESGVAVAEPGKRVRVHDGKTVYYVYNGITIHEKVIMKMHFIGMSYYIIFQFMYIFNTIQTYYLFIYL